MPIIASCGHDVTEEKEQGIFISTGSWEGDKPVIIHQSVCELCYSIKRKRDLSEDQQKMWLSRKISKEAEAAAAISSHSLSKIFKKYNY